MGVNLSELVISTRCKIENFRGAVIAVDAHNTLYQFLASIRRVNGTPLQDFEGHIVAHLKGLLTRTSNIVSAGVRLVFVFDGRPHQLKTDTLERRSYLKERALREYQDAIDAGDFERARMKAQQTVKLTTEIINEAKYLLKALGIPYVDAPAEGEAQASYMARKGDVTAVASQDFDSLLFGSPLLIRNLAVTGRRKLPCRREYISVEPESIELETTLTNLNLTNEQLVDLGILIGTDFNFGLKGIGPKKALKLVQKYGRLENIFESGKYEHIPNYETIRKIFLEPEVTDEYVLEWTAPDRETVKSFLCDKFKFNEEGVDKALAKFDAYKRAVAQTKLDFWG